jgi:hypothetical protein
MDIRMDRYFMDNKSYRFKVGVFDCVAVSDVTNRFGSAHLIYSNVPDEYLIPTLKAHNLSPDRTPMEWSCLLVSTGKYNILVDTGAGPGSEANTGHSDDCGTWPYARSHSDRHNFKRRNTPVYG